MSRIKSEGAGATGALLSRLIKIARQRNKGLGGCPLTSQQCAALKRNEQHRNRHLPDSAVYGHAGFVPEDWATGDGQRVLCGLWTGPGIDGATGGDHDDSTGRRSRVSARAVRGWAGN